MIWISGPAGKLEGILGRPETDCATHAALFCHPHPQYGGTMHNKVVYAAASAARDTGLPVVRFNFRGVGQSEGRYDGGPGEAEDARAAIDYLATSYPGRAIVAGGVSFGAWVATLVGKTDHRVTTLISIATAIEVHGAEHLQGMTKPVLFVQGSDDEFGSLEQIERAVRMYHLPAQVTRVEGTGHLFPGHLDRIHDAVRGFLSQVVNGDANPRPARGQT